MPKLIVQANQPDGEARRVTLSERVLATHIHDDHDATQLTARLTCAAIDVEHLESPKNGEQADEHRGLRPARPPGDTLSSRPRMRLSAGERPEWT